MRYLVWIICFVLCFVNISYATVRFTEVAWMGTETSQYSEWFELYNDADVPVALSGWKIIDRTNDSTIFTLTKTISARGYLLVERTTASAPDAVPGITDESGPFGGGGLSNTGEDIVLQTSAGEYEDELPFLNGWPAGDAETKQTMQLREGQWTTASPTPKTGLTAATDISTSSGDAIVTKNIDPYPIPKISPNKPHIDFLIPSVVYSGVPYDFSAQPVLEYNFKKKTGDIYWNFGDGTAVKQSDVVSLSHTYAYPGTYTLYYSYSDDDTARTTIVGSKKITVTTPVLTVSIFNEKAVEIKNAGPNAVDLSSWGLYINGKNISIPDHTFVAEKGTIVIPISGIPVIGPVYLKDPSQNILVQTKKVITQTNSSDATSQAYEEPVVDVSKNTSVPEEKSQKQNYTKTIIFGVVLLFVIGLSILLERVMARREYQEEE